MSEPKRFKKRYAVIKNNRDFSFLFKKGESVVNYAFVCYFKPRRAGKNRLGLVTGKKIGNAVKRNRSRRIIREAFRLFEPILKEKTDRRFDFVFVARAKTPSLKSGQILRLMKKSVLPKLTDSEAAEPRRKETQKPRGKQSVPGEKMGVKPHKQ